MTCLKILVIFIIAECHSQTIHIEKEVKIQHNGLPSKLLKYIHDHFPIFKIEARAGIQKRDLQGDAPFKVELPAPVVENVGEKKMDTAPLYGFQKPEFIAVPLTKEWPGLNTNIQESLKAPGIPGPLPLKEVEMFGGLPPPPSPPPPPVSVPIVVPPEVPPPNLEVQEVPPPPPPAEPPVTVKTRVRQVAVYAGDVILKYLSQFFNRARITFNRFTSPPPPTPEFEN